MILRTSLSTILFLLISTLSFSQMKVVIMGSSTAYGTGASTYSNSWAGKVDSYLNKNIADGKDTIVYNISFPAYDSYQEMPDDFVPPAGRPLPDMDFNITKALSYNPNVVIINLPSNDISFGYAKYETMNNFRLMSARVTATGARCYFTTPQPRNDFNTAERDSLVTMLDSVNRAFGPFAINFWDGLVTNDGLYSLREEYRAAGTPNHVNDLGHELLFQQVINTIFDFAGPVPLTLTSFQAFLKNDVVSLKWRTEQQEANTIFEMQRSADGRIFEKIFTQVLPEASMASNYTGTDFTPLAGKNFYRLKITEAGKISYSNIINITAQGKTLSISRLYSPAGRSNLLAEINIQKSQYVNVAIINSNGAIMLTQKFYITQPGSLISLPIKGMAAAVYFLKIVTSDGSELVKPFTK